MGDIMGKMWEAGVPTVSEDAKLLQGWSREDLIAMIDRFRGQDKLAIRISLFWRLLNLESKEVAGKVWRALGIKEDAQVDFLSIALPMIAMSKQEHISRVTLMFSVCDFNSDGSIKRSEFFIGLRSLVKGLGRLFPKSKLPTNDELEGAVEQIYKIMDTDRSGELELEEMLAFGYRSRGTRLLLGPFPVADTRIFETLVHFSGQDSRRERTRAEMTQKVESHRTNKLSMNPDPSVKNGGGVTKRRDKPWREPSVVTKPRVFMAWGFFSRVSKENTIKSQVLKELVDDRTQTKEVLEDVYQAFLDEHSIEASHREMKTRLVEGVQTYFVNPGFVAKLEELDNEQLVSFRHFVVMLWPTVPDREVSTCVRWARQFQAYKMLRELTKTKESVLTNAEYDPHRDGIQLDVTQDDIEALFEILDMDGDGTLTVKELMAGGLNTDQAEKLMELWDRDRNYELNKGEIMSIIFGMNQVVRRQMKGLFAASVGKMTF